MTTPIVNLSKSAAVKGFVKNATEKLRDIYGFVGIPYAEPPVDKLRFQPPKPKKLWEGVKECTSFGAIAPQNIEPLKRQFRPYKVPTNISEDCLFLNVYSPSLDKRSKLPVMVWIHGGAFAMGFSNFYDGTAICNFNDVVVVTLNYRLGALGFLCTGDGVIKGNMGLLDQVEAMKWVKKYIHNFGGDPDNITLFGESAGGISIALHMLSPLTKGLFQKAICQSGVATHPGGTWPLRNARKFILKRLTKMGVTSKDSNDILEFLQTVPVETLVSNLEGFQPVIDGTYLPDSPHILYKHGKFHKNIDVMMGFNTHEGAMFINEMCQNQQVDKAKAVEILRITVDLVFFRGVPNSRQVKAAIVEEYLNTTNDQQALMKGLIDLYGDLLFVAPSVFSARQHATKGTGKTYLYQFAHKLSFSQYSYDWIVSDHGAEIMYVFGEPFLGRFPGIFSAEDNEISKNIMSMWSYFAKSGNPDGAIIPEWTQYGLERGEYMVLKPHFEVQNNHEPNRMKLWNETIPKIIEQFKSKY